MQTGPAVRGDEDTILRHLELLKEHPERKGLYALLNKSRFKAAGECEGWSPLGAYAKLREEIQVAL